jgi:hypothetical protein
MVPVKAQASDVKFRGIVIEHHRVMDAEFWSIMIDEIIIDPLGRLSVGGVIHVSVGYLVPEGTPMPARVDMVNVGDRVEVYGAYREEGGVSLNGESYYLIKISGGPADLVVYQCWVSPANPKQEDPVTFYAIIANIGGSDAYNFRLDLYLDGGLYESGYLSLRAGEDMQVWSDKPWIAEDGQHWIRWVINPDGAIQESNYGNNECEESFFVSPRTVTLTAYTTITKTKTQTEKYTMATTVTTYKGALTTETVTKTITITGKATTTTITLTGLYIRTSYSPTITVTVAAQGIAAQVEQLPILLSIIAFVGVMIIPHQKKIWGYLRKGGKEAA